MVALLGAGQPASQNVVVMSGLMNRTEAEMYNTRIKNRLDAVRRDLYEMDVRQGWAALGYASFRQYILAEFPLQKDKSYLYRQRAAADVETFISPTGEVGLLNEATLRPLTKYRKDPDVLATLVAIAQKVAGEGPLTSAHTETTVAVLERAITTGCFADDAGEQTQVWKRLEHEVMTELDERTRQHRSSVKQTLAAQTGRLRHWVIEVDLKLSEQRGSRAKFVSIDGDTIIVCNWPENEPLQPGQRITLKLLADDTL